MLELPRVTLCCIDTVNHALALRALGLCTRGTRFARVLFISDRIVNEPGIDSTVIAPLASRDAYSEFVLKSLLQHIDTAHVLLVQWDGYVVNPSAWQPAFLDCDYIGAKWFWHDDGMSVGNGGFSLRSRKLLEALQDPRIVLTEAEDITIGRAFRPLLEREHGIRYASETLADAFAFEAAYPVGIPFGFHGLYNFCRVVPEDELVALCAHFTPAIARSPQLDQLAQNCVALGQWRAAAAIYRRVLAEQPDDAAAAAGLARAEAGAGQAPTVGRNEPCPCGSGKRYKHCHGAAGAAPINPPESSVAQRMAHAVAAHQRGDTAIAESLYGEVLAIEPEHAVARHYLGVIAYQRGAMDRALPLLEASVRAVPGEPEFHNNLGLAYAAVDRDPEAGTAYRAALALKPDHAIAWNNLGLSLQAMNQLDDAVAAFRRAVALAPDFAQARWNLSLALLHGVAFEEGFALYDARLELAELGRDRHRYPGPVWTGDDPSGKTLLLYAEQGLGDAIQFVRFAGPVADAGARVVVVCAPTLQRLLATAPGVTSVCGADALPPYDAQVALMSLPRWLRTTAQTLPNRVPYLHANEARRNAVRPMLQRLGKGPRIGVAWAGNRAQGNDRNRSMPPAMVAKLLEAPGIAWQSLQHGERAAELDAIDPGGSVARLPQSFTLEDTAALIAELDLVISVDTSIAHLTGALGKSGWVMLAFAPDWRWYLGRDDSPWYPTLRLFRQSAPRDWMSVVAQVHDALSSRAR
jgi:tetratricopeptide (TPR) repeat protein